MPATPKRPTPITCLACVRGDCDLHGPKGGLWTSLLAAIEPPKRRRPRKHPPKR